MTYKWISQPTNVFTYSLKISLDDLPKLLTTSGPKFKFRLFAHFAYTQGAAAQRENAVHILVLRAEKFWGKTGSSSHYFSLWNQPYATRGRHRRESGPLRSAAGEVWPLAAHQTETYPWRTSPHSVSTAAQEDSLMIPILQMGKCTCQVVRDREHGTGI